MLVLSRKIGQGIWITDEIRIVVLESKQGNIRLGIQCPDHMDVERDEVREERLGLEPQKVRDYKPPGKK